jgi:hypothetical protein
VKLFLAGDLKIFLPGAGLALATGMLLGGAMQPQLYDGDRPAGPQIIADFAGERSTGPFDPGTTFAAYHGQTPDYVMGTDWKKALAAPDARVAVTPLPREASDDAAPAEEPVALTRVAYVDPPAPAPLHAYPSLGGAAPSVHAATDADVAADDDTLPAALPDDRG